MKRYSKRCPFKNYIRFCDSHEKRRIYPKNRRIYFDSSLRGTKCRSNLLDSANRRI
ncbi:hypothetical protein ACWIUD_06470 [Helicobacter sp. 23-1044]